MTAPTFNQLKKAFLDSGYEIRYFPRRRLEQMSLDAPLEVKRHLQSDIMGLIMPDQDMIGLTAELSKEERTTTLLHELVHLYDPEIEEDDVENLTHEIENKLTPDQYGFLQFLVS
ncbi:MAG: hypothetical protein K0S20_79 [Patescibacteria group bacterium]|jgi:hypothetical protein|nr:hypothetical protein [Patescibacteria group bacterium]